MNKRIVIERQSRVRQINLRRVAEYHAAGLELEKSPTETRRLIRLALNEAEALAAQTGISELVLPALAEEKVSTLKQWAARQAALHKNSAGWSLTA